MKEFNFNSQVCTDKVQSERLLALGLKKETADMCHRYSNIGDNYEESAFPYSSILALKERMNKPILGKGWEELYGRDIPAWSLHRLIEMMPSKVEFPLSGMPKNFHFEIHNGLVRYYNGYVCCVMEGGGYYKGIIDCIEWLIKEGCFNKEYLE